MSWGSPSPTPTSGGVKSEASGEEIELDLGSVAGRSYAEFRLFWNPPLREEVDRVDLAQTYRRCAAAYLQARDTFVGRVSEQVARSLDTAYQEWAQSRLRREVPDFGARMRKIRRNFQIVVWTCLFSALIGSYFFWFRGDDLVASVAAIPDLPESSALANGGVLPSLLSLFRSVYQYRLSWVVTLLLILFIIWLVSGNRYHKKQMRIDDDIESFLIARLNQIARYTNAINESNRLMSLNTALPAWTEVLAWTIHEPQPAPGALDRPPGGRGPFSRDREDRESHVRSLPAAVRVGEIRLTSTYDATELRRAVERELRRGWLSDTYIRTLQFAFEGTGFALEDVRRQLELGDMGGSDLHPRLLRALRSGDLDAAHRGALEERIRQWRRDLAKEGHEVNLLDMEVDEFGPTDSLRQFLGGLRGPKTAFDTEVWRTERLAEGANIGRSGWTVTGEFQSNLWLLPELATNAPNEEVDVVRPAPVQVDGDEILAAAIRLDTTQSEPSSSFACFTRGHYAGPTSEVHDDYDL